MKLEDFLPKLDWVQSSTFPEPRNTDMGDEDLCLFIYKDFSGFNINKAECFNHESKAEGLEYNEDWYKWRLPGSYDVPDVILAYAFVDWPEPPPAPPPPEFKATHLTYGHVCHCDKCKAANPDYPFHLDTGPIET